MKITSRETYKIVRGILQFRRFTQSQLSKKERVTFSLVNRVVNWFVSRGYVAKRKGFYEITAAGAIFALFPIYRRMQPVQTFDVSLPRKEVLDLLKGKAVLCLTSALAYHDDYYRDDAIRAYCSNEDAIAALRQAGKGYTHVEIYMENLNNDDVEVKNGQKITNKTRTIIDLFCAGKAYAAERLVKKEWA